MVPSPKSDDMWTCPHCGNQFLKPNQYHSCNDRTLDSFLVNKSPEMVRLFHYFVETFRSIGDFELHPAKSQIGLAAKIRFGYIPRIGRNFIDVSLTFPRAMEDNLCFYRIGAVPGGKVFQHYLRLYHQEDINDEVKKFMKLALDYGNKEFPE